MKSFKRSFDWEGLFATLLMCMVALALILGYLGYFLKSNPPGLATTVSKIVAYFGISIILFYLGGSARKGVVDASFILHLIFLGAIMGGLAYLGPIMAALFYAMHATIFLVSTMHEAIGNG